MAQAYMRGISVEQDARASAPLITLFERDDSIAVPLLSQLRMAGYDVRSARTPVELFDILGKNLVTLVLVDLGAATAGRREFWVALDAQRRGRALQVLTFRYMAPANDLDLDFEPSARALADVEIHGAHEFQRIIEAVRQRAPLHGPAPAAAVSYTPDGAIQPLGAALGLAPTPYAMQHDAAYGVYGVPGAPSQQPGFGGYAPLGSQTPSMAGFGSVPSGGFPPQGYPPSPSMPPMLGMQGMQGMQGFGAPVPTPFSAHMETTPFPQGAYGPPSIPFGQRPYQQFQQYPPSQPFGQSFPAQPASPFAQPTTANPFATEATTSPFAQPYGSNPFAQEMSGPSAPSTPSPFAQGAYNVNPFAPVSHAPVSHAGPSVPSAPSSWGAGSGGYVADAPGFAGWRTPDAGTDSFSSDPGVHGMYGMPGQLTPMQRSQPTESASAFQDVWTPPDNESAMETGALSEDAFLPGVNPWGIPTPQAPQSPAPAKLPPMPPAGYGSQERPWDVPRVSSNPGSHGDYGDYGEYGEYSPEPAASAQDFSMSSQDIREGRGRFDESTAAVETPASPASAQAAHSMTHNTSPTETALSSVLVEGALLTPNKLETLRGIQEMLSTVDQPRKLGELAVMFKFLSSDQLLAALLVSRGLVSPQQIASLGRVKQEMAASGLDNDLETLLVKFNILPAEQLRTLRQELAS